MKHSTKLTLILFSASSLLSCQQSTLPQQTTNDAKPSSKQAQEFIQDAENRVETTRIAAERAAWIFSNFTTYDTELLHAKANENHMALNAELALQAKHYEHLDLNPDQQRKLTLLKSASSLPAPQDTEKTAELARISSSLESRYGKGRYCENPNSKLPCLSLTEMSTIMATSRQPSELLDIWQGWRTVSPPMRDEYQRMVEITNQGARELGYADVGVLWRSKYDMPADAFAADYDRQWEKVKPLYQALHCHVRAKLGEYYGQDIVAQDKPIPAHLLGNMWAQQWANIYDLVAPAEADPGYDKTRLIQSAGLSEIEMVKTAEAFFTSLGFAPLPATFWERSLFTKPRDRDVVCHPSAWDIDEKDDLRIKMCIQKTGDDFDTIHHELGHNFYQRAYKDQPPLYRGSANDGFHEAIGDTIALSITPKYLVEIGLLDKEPDPSQDIGLLLQLALDKVAFLPFALLVDKWRWQVFSGGLSASDYNKGWWDLREHYQGVRAPIQRSEKDFDPGAKYHIPGNVSYARYFLAFIQQFQFHRALCQTAGYQGPLHRCTIYNNKPAGQKLAEMLAMGKSKPWPQAMQALTGQSELDAGAIIDYFAPLKVWLDKQNENRQCGW